MFMGFWLVGVVENNSKMDSPILSRDLVVQNFKHVNFLLMFSIFPWGPTKVTCLFRTPNNKFQDSR